jgi:Protein of unknown function (DUF1579)
MKRISLSLSLLILCVAASAWAQMGMPKAGPEVKKLDYFTGSWVSEGDLKAGPTSPGGKFSMTERCDWMPGGFYVVVHSDYKTPMGDGTGIAFYGYDTEAKGYTYDEFNSSGEPEHAKGAVDGDTWTWTSEQKMGGQTIKGRFTMKILTPTSYSFKYEMSPDGAAWTEIMEGKATKKS